MPIPNGGYIYYYVASYSGTLANGATTQLSVRFAEGTTFQLNCLRSYYNGDAVTDNVPLGFSIRMQDAGTGQLLTSDYVPRSCVLGNIYDAQAGLIPMDMLISGKSTWVFDIQNTSGGNITSLSIVLVGIRYNQTAS